MKLFSLLLLTLSFNVFANGVQAVRVFDGRSAYCKTKQDAYLYRDGVYTVSNSSVVVSTEEDLARVTLNVTSLKCAKNGEGFAFVGESLYAPKQYPSMSGDAVKVETLEARLKAMVDGVYEIVADVALDDKVTQKVTIEVSLSDLQVVDGKYRLDVYLTKKQRVSVAATGFDETSLRGYGAFRFIFAPSAVTE